MEYRPCENCQSLPAPSLKLPTAHKRPSTARSRASETRASPISSHSYDADARKLTIQFSQGATYHFADVPEDIAAGFHDAPSAEGVTSKGRYYYEKIHGRYTYTKQENDQ